MEPALRAWGHCVKLWYQSHAAVVRLLMCVCAPPLGNHLMQVDLPTVAGTSHSSCLPELMTASMVRLCVAGCVSGGLTLDPRTLPSQSLPLWEQTTWDLEVATILDRQVVLVNHLEELLYARSTAHGNLQSKGGRGEGERVA